MKPRRILFIASAQGQGRAHARFNELYSYVSFYPNYYTIQTCFTDLNRPKIQTHADVTFYINNFKPHYVINHCYAQPGTPYRYAKAYAAHVGIPCPTPKHFLDECDKIENLIWHGPGPL